MAIWILVEGSDSATRQGAAAKHSKLAGHTLPQAYRVAVFGMGFGRFAVTFAPPTPPYAFTNLIAWLDDPRMCCDSRRAVGGLVSPGAACVTLSLMECGSTMPAAHAISYRALTRTAISN